VLLVMIYFWLLLFILTGLFYFSGGGTGFVGKSLKQYLKNQNYDVTIISRKTNELNKSDSVISWVKTKSSIINWIFN